MVTEVIRSPFYILYYLLRWLVLDFRILNRASDEVVNKKNWQEYQKLRQELLLFSFVSVSLLRF